MNDDDDDAEWDEEGKKINGGGNNKRQPNLPPPQANTLKTMNWTKPVSPDQLNPEIPKGLQYFHVSQTDL